MHRFSRLFLVHVAIEVCLATMGKLLPIFSIGSHRTQCCSVILALQVFLAEQDKMVYRVAMDIQVHG
jgi:hypothetical protein